MAEGDRRLSDHNSNEVVNEVLSGQEEAAVIGDAMAEIEGMAVRRWQ